MSKHQAFTTAHKSQKSASSNFYSTSGCIHPRPPQIRHVRSYCTLTRHYSIILYEDQGHTPHRTRYILTFFGSLPPRDIATEAQYKKHLQVVFIMDMEYK